MNIRKSLAVVALVAFAASAAHAMKVKSFTGTLVIKSGDKTVTYKAGDKVPALKKGDSVTVKDGKAVFDVPNGSISAEAGAGFTMNSDERVAVTAGSVVARSGDKTVTVGSGYTVDIFKPVPVAVLGGFMGDIRVHPTPPAQDQAVVTPVSPSAP